MIFNFFLISVGFLFILVPVALNVKQVHPIPAYLSINPSEGKFLQSPRVTRRGEWHPYGFHMCGQDKYVFGMSLKVDRRKPKKNQNLDSRGLNGIHLYCGNYTARYFRPHAPAGPGLFTSIRSLDGGEGTINENVEKNCGGPAMGFQMRVQKQHTNGDNLGATNLKLLCATGNELVGDGLEEGDWTDMQRCPPKTAICGHKTQVDDDIFLIGTNDTYPMFQSRLKTSDHFGLENMDVVCCPIDHPLVSCNPTDENDLIFSCVNLNASNPVECTYRIKYGISQTKSMSKETRLDATVSAELGFTIEENIFFLRASIEARLGFSVTTGFNWGTTTDDTWTQETEYAVLIKANNGTRVSIYQPKATCGFLNVKANVYFAREFNVGTEVQTFEEAACEEEFITIMST